MFSKMSPKFLLSSIVALALSTLVAQADKSEPISTELSIRSPVLKLRFLVTS